MQENGDDDAGSRLMILYRSHPRVAPEDPVFTGVESGRGRP